MAKRMRMKLRHSAATTERLHDFPDSLRSDPANLYSSAPCTIPHEEDSPCRPGRCLALARDARWRGGRGRDVSRGPGQLPSVLRRIDGWRTIAADFGHTNAVA